MIIPIQFKNELRQLAREEGLKLRFIEKKTHARGYANSRYGEKQSLIRVFPSFKRLEIEKKRRALLHEFGHLIFESERKKREKDFVKLAKNRKRLFFGNPLLCAKAVCFLLDICSEAYADNYIQKFGYRSPLESREEMESVKKLLRK